MGVHIVGAKLVYFAAGYVAAKICQNEKGKELLNQSVEKVQSTLGMKKSTSASKKPKTAPADK